MKSTSMKYMKIKSFNRCAIIAVSIAFLMVLLGCPQEIKEPINDSTPEEIEEIEVPVPVVVTYDDSVTIATESGVAIPSGETVQSGTRLVITPKESEPFLFLTANGKPVVCTDSATIATITLPGSSSAVEYKVEGHQTLAEGPGQYNVRILFAGEKFIPVSSAENLDFYTELTGWFNSGNSNRKANFSWENSTGGSSFQAEDMAFTDFVNSTYTTTFARAPHAAVVSLGYQELTSESFDAADFTAWYGGVLSGYRRVQKDAVVVAVGLPPLSCFTDVNQERYTEVSSAIRAAATAAGATYVDIAALYQSYPAMSTDAALAKRHITEEIFLSFYSKIEPLAGDPESMKINGLPITTTPRQKWSKADDGNQDTVKKNLIQTIKAAGKDKWPQVVFIGDSITDFFDGTNDSAGWTKINGVSEKVMEAWWNETVGWGNNNALSSSGTAATYRALNLGNSGDFTQSLLYRLTSVDGDSSSGAYMGAFEFKDTVKAVVLMIGTNNVGVGTPSSNDVNNTKYQERPISSVEAVKGIQSVIQVLKNGFPNAKIILMGVLPRGDYPAKSKGVDFFRLQVLSTNRQLKELYGSGKDSRVQLLDLYEEFVTSNGTEITGTSLESLSGVTSCTTLFADTVHPSNAGYKVWWDNLKPSLDKLIKK